MSETERLFELHHAALYRFARVLLQQQEDAEDVVQVAFVRLMEHLARDGDRSNLRAWLFTVTANLARDRIRTRRRWMPWEGIEEPGVAAELTLTSQDPQREFLAIAHRLTPRDRLLLALRAQGLSYREIAEAADIKPASVGQLLARALARWRQAREEMSVIG
jgi:RNA polymerase sigma-70 factor (ECF subfamily)